MWRWQKPALVLGVLIAFIAAPGSLPQKLSQAMYGVCGLRASHSYFAGSLQLPLESRMTGIVGGFTLTLLLIYKRLGAHHLAHRSTIVILAILLASMVFDGINSTLAEFSLSHLYMPSNPLRLVTGLLSGVALAPLLVWLLGAFATPRTEQSRPPVIRSLRELALPLALGILFVVLVMQEYAVLYYPVALISVFGVVAVLTIVALLVILSESGERER